MFQMRQLPCLGLLVAFLAAGLLACKEGEGSRCQVDSDCKSGLVCNRATDTCQDSADIDPDASFEPDAMLDQDAPVDGPSDAADAADAAGDGATDAPSDAAPNAT